MSPSCVLYLTSFSFCCLLRSSVSRSEGRRRAISSSLCSSSLRCSNTRLSSGFSSSTRPLQGQYAQTQSHHALLHLWCWEDRWCLKCLTSCTFCGWAAARGAGSGSSVGPLRSRSASWGGRSHPRCCLLWTDGTVAGGLQNSLRNTKQRISQSVPSTLHSPHTPPTWQQTKEKLDPTITDYQCLYVLDYSTHKVKLIKEKRTIAIQNLSIA